MFINFIEIGHNHLLKHPLCESFLHLKWLKVEKTRLEPGALFKTKLLGFYVTLIAQNELNWNLFKIFSSSLKFQLFFCC